MIAKPFGDILGIDNQVAKVLARGDLNLEFVLLFLETFGRHFFIGGQPSLAFGLASTRC